jgi:hypothetical protein
MVELSCETVWQFLTKLTILLLYNLAVMLLDILPKGAENLGPHKNLQVDAYGGFINNC